MFVGVLNSNAVFIYIKRDGQYFGLRDRDFLSDSEITRLKVKFPNYCVLNYYSFENYLYHPDNIEELHLDDFDKAAYIQDITLQKRNKQISIIVDLKKSRDGYEEFKVDIDKDNDITAITDDIISDEFERFYKYFNMRDKFNKSSYQKFLNDKTLLSST